MLGREGENSIRGSPSVLGGYDPFFGLGHLALKKFLTSIEKIARRESIAVEASIVRKRTYLHLVILVPCSKNCQKGDGNRSLRRQKSVKCSAENFMEEKFNTCRQGGKGGRVQVDGVGASYQKLLRKRHFEGTSPIYPNVALEGRPKNSMRTTNEAIVRSMGGDNAIEKPMLAKDLLTARPGWGQKKKKKKKGGSN